MNVMQECSELFAERFIAFGVVSGNNRPLEEGVLHLPWQFAPRLDNGLAKGQSKTIILHGSSMRSFGNGSVMSDDSPSDGDNQQTRRA